MPKEATYYGPGNEKDLDYVTAVLSAGIAGMLDKMYEDGLPAIEVIDSLGGMEGLDKLCANLVIAIKKDLQKPVSMIEKIKRRVI